MFRLVYLWSVVPPKVAAPPTSSPSHVPPGM